MDKIRFKYLTRHIIQFIDYTQIEAKIIQSVALYPIR